MVQVEWSINVVSLSMLLITVAGNIIAWVLYVTRSSDRASSADAKATDACRKVKELKEDVYHYREELNLRLASDIKEAKETLKRDVDSCHSRINDKTTLLVADIAGIRESIAQNYVSQEALVDVEERLAKAIDRLTERFDRFFDRIQKHGPTL